MRLGRPIEDETETEVGKTRRPCPQIGSHIRFDPGNSYQEIDWVKDTGHATPTCQSLHAFHSISGGEMHKRYQKELF